MKKLLPGFTLIEAIVYMGLFGMLIGGAVVAAYSVLEGGGRAETRAMILEEGSFAMAKINWALSGAQAINWPASSGIGSYGSQLSVNKAVGLNALGQPIIKSIVITVTGPNITITEDGGTPQILNNSNVQVTHLGFLHTQASSGGLSPESVEASTTISARTPNGMIVSQDFSSTNYVRR